jgi:hypothetical protein
MQGFNKVTGENLFVHGYFDTVSERRTVSTSFADRRDSFRQFTEETVLSVCSVYKKWILSSDFAKTIPEMQVI